jgi:hypothetical protein
MSLLISGRVRKIKCDEGKPGCLRCSKSGWHCDGYNQDHLRVGSRSTAASRTPSPGLQALSPPSSPILSTEERMYYEFYLRQAQAATSPQRIIDSSSFWNSLVLEESQTNPCIRHLVIAQAARGFPRDVAKPIFWAEQADEQVSNPEFALQQHQKALRSLRISLKQPQSGREARSTLISCIALALFDSFTHEMMDKLTANGGYGAHHIRFGRNLLSSWLSANDPSQSGPSEITLQKDDCNIIYLFIMLDSLILSTMGVDAESPYIDLVPRELLDSIPSSFSTLEEAHHLQHTHIFQGDIFWLRSLKYNFIPKEQIPPSLFAQKESILRELNASHKNLDYLHSQADNMGDVLSQQALVVQYKTTMMLIKVSGTLQAPQTVYDDLLPEFQYLFKHCQTVIDPDGQKYDDNQGRTSTGKEPQSSNEKRHTMPVIARLALYFIGTKCRNYDLRMQASTLLLSQHRNMVIWDSALSANIALWMIGLEEEWRMGGGMTEDDEGYIPEDRRCWGELVERDLQARRALVKCRQNIPLHEGGGWVERNTVIEW